jgi:hypothetical protein
MAITSPSAIERHDQRQAVTQAVHVDRSIADPAALGHDHAGNVTHCGHVDPGAAGPPSAVARHDQYAAATQGSHVDRATADPPVDNTVDIINEIVIQHRRRRFLMEQRKRANNALGAYLRFDVLGWSRALPKQERDAIKKQAKAILATCEAHIRRSSASDPLPDIPGVDRDEIELVLDTLGAQVPMVDREERARAEMERLGQQFPVWPHVADIRGFSALGLAVIVAEAARPLSDYRSPAALWTRMGVGMRDGVRQGGLAKTAAKADWVRHAYDRRRRSRLYVIGDNLIKGNGTGKYKTIYNERKVLEIAKAEAAGLRVAPSAQIPARRRAEFMSLMQVHRRAQRVMEKELLKDIWIAWRRARTTPGMQPRQQMSAAAARPGRPVLLPKALRRSAAAGHDQCRPVTHSTNVDPAADPSAVRRHDQISNVTHRRSVDRSTAEPAASGHDQAACVTQRSHVDPGAAGA